MIETESIGTERPERLKWLREWLREHPREIWFGGILFVGMIVMLGRAVSLFHHGVGELLKLLAIILFITADILLYFVIGALDTEKQVKLKDRIWLSLLALLLIIFLFLSLLASLSD